MKIKSLLFLLLILIITACSDNDDMDQPQEADPEPTEAQSELVGEWQWIQSSGGFAGEVIDPSTTGTNECINIEEDKMIFIADGVVQAEIEYTLEMGTTIHSLDSVMVIKADGITLYGYEYNGVGLKLKDNWYDGYVHSYERK